MMVSRLAVRYAKSIFGLAVEQKQLEEIYKDMLLLNEICAKSRDFVKFLQSPIVHADQKLKIFDKVAGARVTELTKAFFRLVVEKGRESYLPEITASFISQYKTYKGIRVVKLTTAVPVSEEVKNALVRKIKEVSGAEHVEMNMMVNKDIIGGFVFEAEGRLVDASVAYDLNSIRQQYRRNEFIYNLR